MRALHRHRGWLSGWLVAVLLFAQLATAAYACPRLVPRASAPDAAAMADMPDCAGAAHASVDPEQPQLCKAHCEAGSSSVNSQGAAPDAPPALAAGAVWVGVVDAVAVAELAAAMPTAVADGPPAGAPALYLSLLVLRN